MTGHIHNLFIKPAHGQPMQAVDAVEANSGKGLVGDASYGRGQRQVLIIERETLQGFDLAPGQVRENMTVGGITVSGLPPGTRLRAGAALLEVTGDCAPCKFLDDIEAGLQDEMAGRRGTLCLVLEGGAIRVDDAINIVPR